MSNANIDKPRFRKVFICSPFKGKNGEYTENTQKAIKYCQYVEANGFMPMCPHIYFGLILDDKNPVERSMGMLYGYEWLLDCKELWVFGEYISEGMQMDIDKANDMGIPVRRISDKRVDDFMERYRRGITL